MSDSAAAPTPPPEDRKGAAGRVTPSQIKFKNKSLGIVTDESLAAIARSNVPPTLFQQGGHLVRIRRSEDEVFVEPLTIDTLRYHLGRGADFVRHYSGGQNARGEKTVTEPPPLDYVRDLLAAPEWDEGVFPASGGWSAARTSPPAASWSRRRGITRAAACGSTRPPI